MPRRRSPIGLVLLLAVGTFAACSGDDTVVESGDTLSPMTTDDADSDVNRDGATTTESGDARPVVTTSSSSFTTGPGATAVTGGAAMTAAETADPYGSGGAGGSGGSSPSATSRPGGSGGTPTTRPRTTPPPTARPVTPTPPPPPKPQTINFPSPGDNHEWPDRTVTLAASASSGLPVQYRLGDNDGVCTLSGATLQAQRLGGCTVIASQPGVAGTFLPAPDVGRQFYVGGQRVTLGWSGVPGSASIAATGGAVTVSLEASSVNGQPFSGTVDFVTDGTCSGSGESGVTGPGSASFAITLESAGECTISGSISGDLILQAQAPSQTFTIGP